MSRGRVGIAARVFAVVGIFGAVVLQGVGARATDSVTFTSCSSPPSSTPSSTLTPPPDETSSPSPTETPAPANCVPDSGTVHDGQVDGLGEPLQGARTLQFSVQTDSISTHIDSVVAYLDSETSGVASPGAVSLHCPTTDESSTPGCQSGHAAPTHGIYTFDWDTNTITPRNGVYTFRVVATFAGFDARSVQASRQHLYVDNYPQTPNAPRIEVTTSKSVTVGWDANPETDLYGYSLFRAQTKSKSELPTSDQFNIVLSTTERLVRDDVPTPGSYWYKLRATRLSVVRKGGNSSQLSDMSGAGVVAAPVVVTKPKGGGKAGSGFGSPSAIVLTPPGLIPSIAAAPPPVPDAPFSAYLPYKSGTSQSEAGPPAPEAGAGTTDPRGAVLPVAVGAFLVSSALALGRMPYGAF